MTTRDVRDAAHSFYANQQQQYRQNSNLDVSRSQSHSINLITDDFIAGYMQDGRMSVVRRFFCLFVTFDLVFIALLWLICVMISGDNIYNALRTQVLHYTIYTSLFDIVMAAMCRFTVVILFYALLYINHWIIIALSTTGSCAFLVSKVFVYDWTDSPQPVFQVVLIITSFVLAWGEAWFLDCRVIPQERHARSYFSAIVSTSGGTIRDDRSPLLGPFLASTSRGTESIGNFYSPYESIHNSDDESDRDEDYKKMALECVIKAYELLESPDWKIEKVTSAGDTIKSTQRDKLGKIYKLTGKVDCDAKPLIQDLFNKIEEIPEWNPTLLECKIIHKIDEKCDISYQATMGGGGGMVKCRDFVNLRCWQTFENGKIIEDNDQNVSQSLPSVQLLPPVAEQSEGENSVKSESETSRKLQKSNSEVNIINENLYKSSPSTLSKSLGAKVFNTEIISDDDEALFCDAQESSSVLPTTKSLPVTPAVKKYSRVYVSSAISIDYPGFPPTTKYVRGENLVSCWATREIVGESNVCIFEWLLCLDLKGYIPKYVLDVAYTTLMQDYMNYLRKHCDNVIKISKQTPDINH